MRAQNGTGSAYELRINGTTELSGTWTTGHSDLWSFAQVGVNNSTTAAVDFYFDDIAISDSAYPGAGEVRMLKPNGAGATTQWTTGTGNTYAEVDEVPHDSDTTYIKSDTVGQQSDFTMEDAATGGIAGTIGVTKSVAIVRKESGTTFFQLRTNSRGNTSDLDLTTSYACVAKLLTGTETIALVDSLELRPYNGDNDPLRVTALYAMVWCTGQINTTVTPGAASLTTTRYSPSAKVNTSVTPGALSLTTTRYTPTALLNSIATPGALSAALTAYAPAATVGLAVTPGTASLILTAYTPTVINPQSATPGTLALALTAYEPGAVVNSIVTPGALTTALTAYAPAALLNNIVTPGALSASLTAYAPSAIVNFIVTPGAGSLAIATYGINIYLPGSAFGARQYWRSTQHKEYTKLVPYRDYRRATTYKDYIKSVKWVDRA